MKALIVLALALCVTAPALAVTPEQAGTYTGKLITTYADFNTKKITKDTRTIIMLLDIDGTTSVGSSIGAPDTADGTTVLGAYSGVLNLADKDFVLRVKGKSITGTSSVVQSSPPDDGGVFTQIIKVKKSKFSVGS